MKRIGTIIGMLIVSVSLLGGIACAWPGWVKKSPSFSPGKSFGYFLWHDKGWNLVASGDGKKHVFDGTISCNKSFSITHQDNLESGQGDYVQQSAPGKLTFHLTVSGDSDGFGFKTTGSFVSFDLKVDGTRAAASAIVVGSGNKHPKVNPFKVNNKKKTS